MMTEGNLMSMLVKKRVSKDDPVSKVLYKSFKQVPTTATLGHVSRLLDREPFVLVVSEQRCCEWQSPQALSPSGVGGARTNRRRWKGDGGGG